MSSSNKLVKPFLVGACSNVLSNQQDSACQCAEHKYKKQRLVEFGSDHPRSRNLNTPSRPFWCMPERVLGHSFHIFQTTDAPYLVHSLTETFELDLWAEVHLDKIRELRTSIGYVLPQRIEVKRSFRLCCLNK